MNEIALACWTVINNQWLFLWYPIVSYTSTHIILFLKKLHLNYCLPSRYCLFSITLCSTPGVIHSFHFTGEKKSQHWHTQLLLSGAVTDADDLVDYAYQSPCVPCFALSNPSLNQLCARGSEAQPLWCVSPSTKWECDLCPPQLTGLSENQTTKCRWKPLQYVQLRY